MTEESVKKGCVSSPAAALLAGTSTSDFEDALRARLAAWLDPTGEQPAKELPSIPDYLWANAEKVEFPITLSAERRSAARRVALSMGLYPRSDGPKTARYMTVFAPDSPEYVPLQALRDRDQEEGGSSSADRSHRGGRGHDFTGNGNDGRSRHSAGTTRGGEEQGGSSEPMEIDQKTQIAIECKLIQWQKPEDGYCAPKVREARSEKRRRCAICAEAFGACAMGFALCDVCYVLGALLGAVRNMHALRPELTPVPPSAPPLRRPT